MRLVLLCLAFVLAVLGFQPTQAAAEDCCPCAEEHELTEGEDSIDCCLPGPHQCACGVVPLAALPRLPELESGPAPTFVVTWMAVPPDALHTLPRPPPPTPPPIG